MYCVMQFLQLFIDIRAGRGVADVGVDLTFAGDADSHGLKIPVIHVGGNDHPTTRHFAADQFGFQLFALGNELHFFGDCVLPRQMHLRNVSVAVHCSYF